MYKKSLVLSCITLSMLPLLQTSETVIKNKNHSAIKKSLFHALDLIKESISEIYKENKSSFDQVKNSDDAFSLYQDIIKHKKNNIQKAYEDKFESRWYWFGYWKWYATWSWFISTINDMIGAGIDSYDSWATIKPVLTTALLTYLGTAGAVPIIGWIMGGAATSLAISIVGAVAGHQLWSSPQNERGIVMTFYLVFYTGSWSQ